MTKKEDYRLLIETEWKDIHHSRIQEWSALGVISAIHFGLLQLLRVIHDTSMPYSMNRTLTVIACTVAILFALIGVLMVCRHRRLMWVKLNWIYEAEERLGLIKTKKNKKGIILCDYKMKKINRGYETFSMNDKFLDPDSPSDDNIWNKLIWPRFLSTSWFIAIIYILLGLIDIGFLVVSILIPKV